MKISWLILTYNRAETVKKAIRHCMANSGRQWEEIIWVDNGSSLGERDEIDNMFYSVPQESITKCMIGKNLGVAKGYNTAMALARGTHIVITGCDMMMPNNWLAQMATSFQEIPNTGIVTIYASPMLVVPERIRGDVEVISGIKIQPAMPIGRRMLSVELQREIGYFHEGFGLYGWDDVAWGHRAENVCTKKGLRFYNLPDMIAEHLGTEGNVGFDHKDEHEYWKWKQAQVKDPAKMDLLEKLRKEGWPGFHPY